VGSLITSEKIEEWIREIEERPSSGAEILRLVSKRLLRLAHRNEELLAENIQLRAEKKVEEYEERIANLQYQLELLKRQVGGELLENFPASQAAETTSLLIYTPRGEVLRIELPVIELSSRMTAGSLVEIYPSKDPASGPPLPPRLLVTGSQEELLFLFDSGRTTTIPAAAIPAYSGTLDWKQAYLEEPRGAEELAAIVPIGRMSLADCWVQVSRRGCVKKMMSGALETYVAKNFVGAGVVHPKDRTFTLALCAKDDRLVLASKEGYLLTLESGRLSYTIEDTLQLTPTDHVVDSFPLGSKPLVVFLTQQGKVISRETSWLKQTPSLRSRGQALYSDERRKSGVKVIGGAAVDESDWAATLDRSGRLMITSIQDLLGAGSVPSEPGPSELVTFAAFSAGQETQ